MRPLLRSFSFRLALAYAGLLCLSVALLMGAGYWMRVTLPLEHAGAQVEAEAGQFARIARTRGLGAARILLERRMDTASGRKPFHALLAADGTILTANLPSWPRAVSPRLSLIEADRFIDGSEIEYNALVRDEILPDGTRLLIGRDVEDITREKALLETAALWILGGTVVLGLSGGWMMSRAIGARIEMVTRAARRVMAGDLSGRVPLRGSRDDFDQLGETLNLMLARNQSLFDAVRRVSDNVAHELRTPLARLVGTLEILERRAVNDPAMRTEIEMALAEAHRLRQIFAALVRISRLEGGRHALSLRCTDVVGLLEDVVEFHQPDAERRGIALTLDAAGPIVAELDADLVFQALSNLLDNALKYTPAGGHVRASVSVGNVLDLQIADDGPGLDPAEIGSASEQFWRGSAAVGMPGEGLGLSMVAAIAQVHGGELVLADNRPGLRAGLALPLHLVQAVDGAT